MYVKTIKRALNRILVYREGELVNIAIMDNDDKKIQEIILSRSEIDIINKWVKDR